MNFGQAIESLKAGKKVSRGGWNGKGMWLVLMPGATISPEMVNERTRTHVPDPAAPLRLGAYVVMWTADGTWQPGWLASQADMLAEDWETLP